MSSIEELKYHLVFATKYRYNIISVKIATLLKNYFLKQQEKLGFQIISLAIESNHIHMLFQLNSSTQDHNEIIEKIKRGSSFLARKKFSILKRYTALWTQVHIVSHGENISKEIIENYINSQGIEDEVIQRTFKYRILTPTKHKLEKLKTYFQECSSKLRSVTPASIYQDFDNKLRYTNMIRRS
jgi:putative transposase